MPGLVISLFTVAIYQPFLNILILFYEGLERFLDISDMGLAVILFTIIVRLILLPLSLISGESEDEKRQVGQRFEEIRRRYRDEPVRLAQAKEGLVREHTKMVRAEFISLAIQGMIAIALWRIFSHGLAGADLHLLYNFVPPPQLPFHMIFLGSIDLSQPSLFLNLVSSCLLFLAETLSLSFSAYPTTRNDRIMQFIVPIIVFMYLYKMPAGKKLFVITTLVITLIIILFKETWSVLRLWQKSRTPPVRSYGKLAKR